MKTNNLEEHTFNETLSIQVSLDGFSFYAQDDQTSAPKLIMQHFIEETRSPDQLLREIEKVFKDKEELLENFNSLEVVYRNELFTIVPTALFEPERLTDYLKYNTKILSTDFIVYDEIKPYDLVVIYIPFANVNNYFFDQFGTFSYHHSMTLFIKEVLNDATAHKKQAVVHLDNQHFDLVAHDGKKLLLANTFTYENAEDFLYHILFCYEQLDFDPDQDVLIIMGDIETKGELYQLAHTYLRNINISKKHIAASEIGPFAKK